MEDETKYQPSCYRFAEETRANLKKYRAKSGKTWNMFAVELIKDHEAKLKKLKKL